MNCTHRLYLRVLSTWIASLIVVQTATVGQSRTGFAIQVLEAKSGQNLIAQEIPPIKVRVMDRTGRAIAGANVVFVAPAEGPTGHFLPNAAQISVASDSEGIAASPRFRTNSVVGDYEIQLIASYRDSVSRVLIPQSNVVEKKSSRKKFIIVSALIGGATAAAFAGRSGSSRSASSALGELVTPTLTLGGESAVSISSSVVPASPTNSTTAVPTMPPTSTSTMAPSSSTGVSSAAQPIAQPALQPEPPVSPACAQKSNGKKPKCR
ncbi:MAG TPA: hypothetical protein VMT78_06650 [Terriglobia bacterium]|nr:hypothetical protein [Terriglobia bacterium]